MAKRYLKYFCGTIILFFSFLILVSLVIANGIFNPHLENPVPNDSFFELDRTYYIIRGIEPSFVCAKLVLMLSPFLLVLLKNKDSKVEIPGQKIKLIVINLAISVAFFTVLWGLWEYSGLSSYSIRVANNAKVIRLSSVEVQELDTNRNGTPDTMQVDFTLNSDREASAWGGTNVCFGNDRSDVVCKDTYTGVDFIPE